MRKYFEHDNVNESPKYIGASKRKPGKKIAYIAVTTALTLGAFFVGKTCFPKTEIRTETVEIVPNGYVDTGSEEFLNNYVDMCRVVDFTASENGLQLYMSDGSGYYWEK